MELNEIRYTGQPPVDAYGPGFFRVREVVQDGPLAILPSGVATWGGLNDWTSVIAARSEYDVVFVGMGADIAPLPAKAKAKLEKADVPYDVMSTPAACRTYNVLLSEGRRVAIVALPV
jgi:uncharacterized protein